MTATLTSVDCMHCGRTCGSLAGLSAHMRSMHPDKVGNQPVAREAPPEAATPGGIVWEDPPGKGNKASIVTIIAPLIIELRRNPGRWARLQTWDKKGGANSAKTKLGQEATYPDIEFTARVTGESSSALYGRYVEAD